MAKFEKLAISIIADYDYDPAKDTDPFDLKDTQ